LASAISGSANISAIADGSGAVFSYDAGTKTYTLQRDITWDANLTGVSSTTDYLILTAGEVIDGNDKIIYTTANLYGFIATTVSGDSAFTNVPLVKNLTVKPTNGKWFSMFTKES
jgi:hypothetical protein